MKTFRNLFYLCFKIMLLAELCGFQVAIARQCLHSSEEELVKTYDKEVVGPETQRLSLQKRDKKRRLKGPKPRREETLAYKHRSKLFLSPPREGFTFGHLRRANGIGCPLRP